MDGFLVGFEQWAVQNRWATSTGRVYRSLLRGFFHTQEREAQLVSTPDRLRAEALAHESALQGESRRMFRRAIRAFLAFVAADRGLSPSELTIAFPDRRRARTQGIVDHPIAPFLREFFSVPRIPVKWTERIRWGDVRVVRNDRTGEPTGIARITFQPARFPFDVPLVLAQQMSLWAGGGKPAAAELPFIPSEPLSKLPMPVARIRRLAGMQVDRALTTLPRFILEAADRVR